MKELQDNIAAVNFTPHSKMGKLLMAKCRTLQEENEEIETQAKEGKVLLVQLSFNLQLGVRYLELHLTAARFLCLACIMEMKI